MKFLTPNGGKSNSFRVTARPNCDWACPQHDEGHKISHLDKNDVGKPLKVRRGRPSQQEKLRRGDMRVILLKAARDLMLEKESIEISMSEIAQKTGQSSALVQYHFGSKSGLLRAVLETGAEKAVQQLNHLRSIDIPVEAKFRAHIGGLMNAYFEAPYFNPLLRAVLRDVSPEEGEYLMEQLAKPVMEFHRSLLEQGAREGIFKETDPKLFYCMAVGACSHLFSRGQAHFMALGFREITEDVRRSYADFVCQTLLHGIRT